MSFANIVPVEECLEKIHLIDGTEEDQLLNFVPFFALKFAKPPKRGYKYNFEICCTDSVCLFICHEFAGYNKYGDEQYQIVAFAYDIISKKLICQKKFPEICRVGELIHFGEHGNGEKNHFVATVEKRSAFYPGAIVLFQLIRLRKHMKKKINKNKLIRTDGKNYELKMTDISKLTKKYYMYAPNAVKKISNSCLCSFGSGNWFDCKIEIVEFSDLKNIKKLEYSFRKSSGNDVSIDDMEYWKRKSEVIVVTRSTSDSIELRFVSHNESEFKVTKKFNTIPIMDVKTKQVYIGDLVGRVLKVVHGKQGKNDILVLKLNDRLILMDLVTRKMTEIFEVKTNYYSSCFGILQSRYLIHHEITASHQTRGDVRLFDVFEKKHVGGKFVDSFLVFINSQNMFGIMRRLVFTVQPELLLWKVENKLFDDLEDERIYFLNQKLIKYNDVGLTVIELKFFALEKFHFLCPKWCFIC